MTEVFATETFIKKEITKVLAKIISLEKRIKALEEQQHS
jgi:hypothetical protein